MVQHMCRVSQSRHRTQLIRAPSAGIKKREDTDTHSYVSFRYTHVLLYIYKFIYIYIFIRRDFFGFVVVVVVALALYEPVRGGRAPVPAAVATHKPRTTLRTWTTTMPSDMLLNYKTSKETRTQQIQYPHRRRDALLVRIVGDFKGIKR